MKTNLIIVFWKALEMIYKNMQKHIGCPIEKILGDLALTLATPPKVKLIAPVNRSFEILQLLSKTFFSEMLSFRDISSSRYFLYTLYIIFKIGSNRLNLDICYQGYPK